MDLPKEWEKTDKVKRRKILKSALENANVQNVLPYLDLVRAPKGWGIYASSGPHYTCAVFGRDSLVVADDIMEIDQTLVLEILLALARLQGVARNEINEEEPGKIHHEYRSKQFNDVAAHPDSLHVLTVMQAVWGGAGGSDVIYYGSFDATLLYIRTLNSYLLKYGQSILQSEYTGRDNKKHTVAYSLRQAVLWMVQKIEASEWGLFEFKRINPNGYLNQAWKDSVTAYLDEDGGLPNYKQGIASIELQGYAYDALLCAARIASLNDEEANKWKQMAAELQSKTLKLFWMPHQSFFAQALDHDEHQKPRQIKTLTSNGAAILDSNLLYDLPELKRRKYLKGIARVVCGPEFLTPAGIRSRAAKYANIPNYIDYHGSFTVWPKEANVIIKGLRKQGLLLLADKLTDLVFKSLIFAGEFPEFLYVEMNNTVWYDRDLAKEYFRSKYASYNLYYPEADQAWTISAAIQLSLERSMRHNTVPVHDWELEIIGSIPKTSELMQFI